MYKRNKRPFGSILPARNESEGLRVKIVYYKTSYTFPTGLGDTDHNRNCIRNMLNHIYSQIQDGTFRFAEVFKDADPEKKKYFSKLEDHKFRPRPDEVTVRSYAEEWYEEWSDSFKELDKTTDYESALRRILAEIGDLTFEQLNTVAVENFLGGLVALRGKRKGLPVSLKRKKNILSVLRRLWKTANA